ncbi:hypothetical protein Pla110_17680 [Polystyrenella longa]|uniref:FAD-dependent urate hydroxylase HpyO/Asp monooxygenase CreE-like FAD/NAD(P)-binding domain-containing protein n=1 Tax=Polystyrenella longa TaxID=2528007 RepID=A0A518CLF0_9PLAN|nr:FAD/NAD(P)-binding domain-containing protein [Polystyrenella longa]QDU80046.1 hypothetical protein Pla110_17680 [Polystyrenella longa]
METNPTQKHKDTPVGKESALKIAIVGGGPRGLYSLERLLHYARQIAPQRIRVCLYDTSGQPGAGTVYSPKQPAWLLMNYSSKNIDAWVRDDMGSEDPMSPESIRHDLENYPSLVQWLDKHHPEMADPDQAIPRAIAGEYFRDCYAQVLREKPENVSFVLKSATVKDVVRQKDRWAVMTVEESQEYDEVLLSLGHGANVGSANPEEWFHPHSYESRVGMSQNRTKHLVNSTYPVAAQLSEEKVQPGSKVAIRGFGLTFIDACLSLTEGRGGKFKQLKTGEWEYEMSGHEPEIIYPYSRTGRPMLAKPDARKVTRSPGLSTIWKRGKEQLRKLESSEYGLDFNSQMKPILVETAAEALRVQQGEKTKEGITSTFRYDEPSSDSMLSWLAGWSGGTVFPVDIWNRLTDSYRTATGLRPADEAWAIAETWRELYPALVERISYGGLSEASWELFQLYAAEMERIAFGPPAESVGKLLALIKSGLVELRFLTGSPVAFVKQHPLESQSELILRNDQSQIIVDSIVNAVLPASQHATEGSLLYNLLQRKTLSRFRNTGGIAVDHETNALNEMEHAVSGLSVVGRPTEGCVLGNDTLSRTLHPESDRWAKRLIKSFTQTNSNMQMKLKNEELLKEHSDTLINQA